jgi:predicted RNA-binding Zn-ribbon protein involved in translation (DUF1610 family)
MPTKRVHRSMEFQCRECGYEFVASVPHLVDYAEDSLQPIRWTAERIGVTCPSCGSWRVEVQDA